MSGYLFVSNSSKPTESQQNSREAVALTNVSRPCLQEALNLGYEVYFGINRNNPEGLSCELPVHLYDSHTYRSVTGFKDNFIAYKNIRKTIRDGHISVIHCNTPIGGMIGRICGRQMHVDKVIYTAHGFHFYKGAPLFHRTVIKLAEQIMARWTDAIITMNQEDYEAAQKLRLKKGGKVYRVHGVGVNVSDYQGLCADPDKKRDELGLIEDDIVLISMGDLIDRKNYSTAIRAIAQANNPRLKYLICGNGPEREKLSVLTKSLHMEQQVIFLGFRNDTKELLKAADIFLFTTKQEGLPRSMMEAMASGLPCIASKIRGNIDLIEDGVNGFLFEPSDVDGFSGGITTLANAPDLCRFMAANSLEKMKEYDVSVVEKEIMEIYKEVLINTRSIAL